MTIDNATRARFDLWSQEFQQASDLLAAYAGNEANVRASLLWLIDRTEAALRETAGGLAPHDLAHLHLAAAASQIELAWSDLSADAASLVRAALAHARAGCDAVYNSEYTSEALSKLMHAVWLMTLALDVSGSGLRPEVEAAGDAFAGQLDAVSERQEQERQAMIDDMAAAQLLAGAALEVEHAEAQQAALRQAWSLYKETARQSVLSGFPALTGQCRQLMRDIEAQLATSAPAAGTSLAGGASSARFCTSCGAPRAEGRFCVNCGTPFTD